MWLLRRIRDLESNSERLITRKAIFSGSYDVWQDEQDRLDQLEICKNLIKLAEDAGYIVQEQSKVSGTCQYTVWRLTNLGLDEIYKEQ
jgi:hypothetical protein